MEEAQQRLLLAVVFSLIFIVLVLSLSADIFKRTEGTNLLGEGKERIDIIISDRVPVGCFIPPENAGSTYSIISGDDELKKICLKYEEPSLMGISGSGLVPGSAITGVIANGIKLDGYCYDSKRETCLDLDEYLSEGEKGEAAKRRNIEFGQETKIGLGSGFGKKEFSSTGLTPSVFVVAKDSQPMLSIYAGIKLTGNKSVEKIVAGIYSSGYADEADVNWEIIAGSGTICQLEQDGKIGMVKALKPGVCRLSAQDQTGSILGINTNPKHKITINVFDSEKFHIMPAKVQNWISGTTKEFIAYSSVGIKSVGEIEWSTEAPDTCKLKEGAEPGTYEAITEGTCTIRATIKNTEGTEPISATYKELISKAEDLKDPDQSPEKNSRIFERTDLTDSAKDAEVGGVTPINVNEEKTFVLKTSPKAISKIIGEEKNCYFGKNYKGCYESKKNAADCECSETERYFDEPAIDICKNFAASDSSAIAGCEEGEKRNCYLDCILNNDGKTCASGTACSCPDCETVFENLKNIDNPCTGLGDREKGCEKFFEFEKNVFQVKAGTYTIVKVGDIGLYKDKFSRGLAYASAKVTVIEPHPGLNCYSPKTFSLYTECCDEACKEGGGRDCKAKGCSLEENSLLNIFIPNKENTCAEKTNCSLAENFETDDRFVLCKNFCESYDAYYNKDDKEMHEKIKDCTEGCDEAERMDKIYGDSDIGDIELVFIEDTSTNLKEENDIISDAIDTLKGELEDSDRKVTVTIYQLAKAAASTGQVKRSTPEESTKIYLLPCDVLAAKGALCKEETDPPDLENWGPAANWVLENFQWNNDKAIRAIFVVSDEGPVGGGTKKLDTDCEENTDEEGFYNTKKDCDSVDDASKKANENGILIYGLYAKPESGASEDVKDRFYKISKPTGGDAYLIEDSEKVTQKLRELFHTSRGEAYERGYSKYVDLSNNKVNSNTPYIFTRAYDEVDSNRIYIVDWDPTGSSGWCYPYTEISKKDGTLVKDWSAIKIQKTNDVGIQTPMKKTVAGSKVIYQSSFDGGGVAKFVKSCYDENSGTAGSGESEALCYVLVSGVGFGSSMEGDIKNALPEEMKERFSFNLGSGKSALKISYVGSNGKVRIS